MRPAAPFDFYLLVVVAIVRVTSWFPFPRVRGAMARLLASLAYHLSADKRALMRQAVGVAFGARLDGPELTRIVKDSFFNGWLEILGTIPNGIDAAATGHARLMGWERLERALAAGKGVILWESGCFGRRFWAKQVLYRKGVPVQQIHHADHFGQFDVRGRAATWLRQNVIGPFFDGFEKQYLADLIKLPSDGDLAYGRTLLRRLGQNAVVCTAADGSVGARLLSVPFLGATRSFSAGLVSLAKASGATILPIVCLRTGDGKACLVIEEAISVSDSGDRESQNNRIALHYAGLMEGYVLRDPGAYMNWPRLARRPDQTVSDEPRPD